MVSLKHEPIVLDEFLWNLTTYREFDLNGMNLGMLNRFMDCLSANLRQRYTSNLPALDVLLIHYIEGLSHGRFLIVAGELKEINLLVSL